MTKRRFAAIAATALIFVGLLFGQTGVQKVRLWDTNLSHSLLLNWNENDTAGRTLSFLIAGADRSLTISGDSYIDQDVRIAATPTWASAILNKASGDPVLQFSLASTPTFTMGVDDSYDGHLTLCAGSALVETFAAGLLVDIYNDKSWIDIYPSVEIYNSLYAGDPNGSGTATYTWLASYNANGVLMASMDLSFAPLGYFQVETHDALNPACNASIYMKNDAITITTDGPVQGGDYLTIDAGNDGYLGIFNGDTSIELVAAEMPGETRDYVRLQALDGHLAISEFTDGVLEYSDDSDQPIFRITNNSATARDPVIQWAIGASPAVKFTAGVDDSDSDKWKLSLGAALGTDDLLVASSAGLSTPLQFTSTLADGGVSPFAVTSAVKNANLNADLWDSLHAPALDSGKFLTNNGTVLSWAAALTNPMDAIGDIIYGGVAGVPTKLADVAVGSYLASGGIATAPAWATLNQAAFAVGSGLATADGPTFNHLHITNTLSVGDTGVFYGKLLFAINDDAVYSFTPTVTRGFLFLTSQHPSIFGIVTFDTTSYGTTCAVVLVTAVERTNGVLTGTTGTDGKITISAHTDGKIYIENRSGGVYQFGYTLIAGA